MDKPRIKVEFQSLYPLIQDAISRGNTFSFTAFGSSMHPFIRGGVDRVTLSPMDREPKKGDVLFYRRLDGSFVLHRVVGVRDSALSFCGDNQFTIEKGIQREQILARLDSRERNGKEKKADDITDRLWCALLPVRRVYLRGRNLAGRIFRKLKKIGRKQKN